MITQETDDAASRHVLVMLGTVLERTSATRDDVREMRGEVRQIRDRLAHGDAQFAELRRRMDSNPKREIGQWERLILEAVRIGQFLLVLWLTGSIDAAVHALGGK